MVCYYYTESRCVFDTETGCNFNTLKTFIVIEKTLKFICHSREYLILFLCKTIQLCCQTLILLPHRLINI